MLKFLTRNPDIRPNPDHLATLVGVFAVVLVRVESQGHTVHVNNALLGGLELHQNQQNNHKFN